MKDVLGTVLINHFNKNGKVLVHMKRDELGNILSYLFHHSRNIEVRGAYTLFEK
jgi:hypothetical protein